MTTPAEPGETPRAPGRPRTARTLGTLASATLLALIAVAAGVRERDESTAYAVGAAIGTLMIGLLIAVVIRLLWKLVRKGAPTRSPWTLLIACPFSLLSLIGAANRDDPATSPAERAAIARCVREEPPINYPQLEGGLTYVDVEPDVVRQLARELPADPPEVRAEARVRLVARGEEPVVVLTSAPVGEDPDREAIVAGYVEGARSAGTVEEPVDLELGGRDTTLVRSHHRRDGPLAAVIATARCRALIVVGPRTEEPLVRDVASRTLAANPD